MRFAKPLLFTLILCCLPVLLLLLVEGGLRLAGFGIRGDFFLKDRQSADTLRLNPDYTWVWFGKSRLREPFPVRIPVAREPGNDAFRIAIVGASAAMGDPEPAFSPARMLEAGLALAYPEQRFDCINLAITAINSHVVRRIATELNRIQPDAVIIYLGNNEVVGPYGPGTEQAFGRNQILAPQLHASLRQLRLVQLIHGIGGSDELPADWEGMAQFTKHQFPADAPQLDRVYEQFAGNLRHIIRSALATDALVISSTIAVNLRTHEAFAGADAHASFARGKQAHADGNLPEALELLRNARNQDTLRFRADSTINNLIRTQIPKQPKLISVDAARAFNHPGSIAGDEAFVDHVHFTFHGTHRLAALFAQPLIERWVGDGRLPEARAFPGESLLRVALAYTTYEDFRIAREMLDRHQKPPFSSRPHGEQAIASWREREQQLRTRIATRSERDRTIETYELARQARPDDWILRRNHAQALALYGQHARSAQLLAPIAEAFPESDHLHALLGGALIESGDFSAAEYALQRALARRPFNLSAQSDYVVALLRQGKAQAALAALDRVAALTHDNPPIVFHFLRFEAFLASGQLAQAGAIADSLLATHPDNPAIPERLNLLRQHHGVDPR